MQDPYTPANWVALLLGANIRVDFSNANRFEEAFQDLLKRIRFLEEDLEISPRKYLLKLTKSYRRHDAQENLYLQLPRSTPQRQLLLAPLSKHSMLFFVTSKRGWKKTVTI
jgi:hypothetical protein